MTESATCCPWIRWMKSLPSLQKKIEAYEEEKRDEKSPFHPNPIQFIKKNTSTKRSNERSSQRSKQRKVDIGHFAPSKAKRPAFSWALLPGTNTTTTTTTTIANNPRITTRIPPMACSCKTCKRWSHPVLLCSIRPTSFTPGIRLE